MFLKQLFLLLLVPVVFAQLPLPDVPFLPPPAASGAVPSTSGSPNPQWSTLLGNLLFFYEAQRSGNLSATDNRVSWRNSSCVKDGEDVGLDLTGGYYDAGDYIKTIFPLSFTVMSICWGALDFGKGYDSANQTAYLDSMLRYALDWLIKAHPSENTLFVQIADAMLDNAYWGGDVGIPGPRPSYQINSTAPGTDVAAGASAAFSACSALYAGRSFNGSFPSSASLQNLNYSQTLLSHAEQLYSFAVNATGGQKLYQKSVPVVSQSYASSSYGDELTVAALFLAWAQNSTERYQDSIGYYNQFGLKGQDAIFNWDSKTPGLAVLFSQIAQSNSGLGGDLSNWQTEAERYFDKIVQKQSGFLTGGGLLFYEGDSDDASLNPALNAAMLMTRYAPMATSSDKKTAYLNYAQSQVDYVLGKNPMSVPYIVGSNPNSPSNPHSALATASEADIGLIDSVPEQETYVLYGAVVGGPNRYDNFYDIRSDWPETEVALDYNAPMLTLAAMHVLNDPNDPFFTKLPAGEYLKVKPQGLPCDAAFPNGCGKHRLSTAAKVVMGVIISVLGLVIFSLLGSYLWINCRKR
ncbi:glycoside hydrolase family 9 protein [Mycena floridula]|nr:glycoside hydrolase family 9 protein [Mycena floridula]